MTIILGEISGAEAATAATSGPIWLRASPGNRRVAEGLWSDSKLPIGCVTTFDPPPGCSAEEASFYILGTVIEHHPAWTSMRFIGAEASPTLAQELASYGGSAFRTTEGGFVVSRKSDEM